MTLSASDSAAFLAARAAVARGAVNAWIQAQGVDRDDAAAVEAAKARWQCITHLIDSQLENVAYSVLGGAARSAVPVAHDTPFPASIWYGGATDTRGGFRFKGTVGDFIEHVLIARSQEVAPKRQGWVVTPTTCSDGHRVNASTTAVHALNLDCDGRGPWDRALTALSYLGIAFVAYQSGGWSPSSQKWHLLIPLARPYETGSPEKILAWRAAYHSARVVFGALAGLPGEGFDGTVDTPCVPVFITERRAEIDTPRKVVWRSGCALDIDALVAFLPTPPVELPERRERSESNTEERDALADDKLESIVVALCGPMGKILSGRRDLYLALPGALLARGLLGDDVVSIVEEVSLRCPGDPSYTAQEVTSKHKEHIHCAETTVQRHESGQPHTQFGTLYDSWPEVVDALDAVLPDKKVEEARAMLAQLRASRERTPLAAVVEAIPRPAEPVVPAEQHFSYDLLVGELRALKNRKCRSKDVDDKLRGEVLRALLEGEDLQLLSGDDVVSDSREYKFDRSGALKAAMGMVTYKLPFGVAFDAVAEIFRRSLHAMLAEGETMAEAMQKTERLFKRAVDRRTLREAEREKAAQKQREHFRRQFNAKGAVG